MPSTLRSTSAPTPLDTATLSLNWLRLLCWAPRPLLQQVFPGYCGRRAAVLLREPEIAHEGPSQRTTWSQWYREAKLHHFSHKEGGFVKYRDSQGCRVEKTHKTEHFQEHEDPAALRAGTKCSGAGNKGLWRDSFSCYLCVFLCIRVHLCAPWVVVWIRTALTGSHIGMLTHYGVALFEKD